MRRDELAAATNNVIAVLQGSGLVELVEKSHGTPTGAGWEVSVLDVLRKYSQLATTLGAAERQLFAIFGLDRLDDMQFWQDLGKGGFDTADTHTIRVAVNRFKDYVPRIVALLENDALRARAAVATNRAPDTDVLTVILIEDRGHSSRPARIIDAIRSVTQLYEACAILTNVDPDSLSVVGCDSGSDKSFDFLGVAAAIEALKALIIGIWDRAVFHRQTQNDANLHQALKTLALVERVAQMQSDGVLEHEHGERLKHQLIANAGTFVGCGILIPEITAHTSQNPRSLLAPQPKLLTGASVATGDESSPPAAAPEPGERTKVLTPEEEALLRKLLGKAQGTLETSGDGS